MTWSSPEDPVDAGWPRRRRMTWSSSAPSDGPDFVGAGGRFVGQFL
ncbi:hypothetical protein ACIGT4_25920 [Streptomyces sioyaensis]